MSYDIRLTIKRSSWVRHPSGLGRVTIKWLVLGWANDCLRTHKPCTPPTLTQPSIPEG